MSNDSGDHPVGRPHDYPLEARGSGFFSAFALGWQVLPYSLFRCAHWGFFALVSSLLLALAVGPGIYVMQLHRTAGVAVLLAGLAVHVFLWLPFVHKKTFGTRCAHIALLTRLVTHGSLPEGESQLSFGNRLVERHLGDLDAIWKIHAAIHRSLYRVTRILRTPATPQPNTSTISRFIQQAMRGVARYLGDTVVSYGVAREGDFAVSSRDGAAYCLQNSTKLIKTGTFAYVIDFLLSLPVRVVGYAGAFAIVFVVAFIVQGGNLAALDLANFQATAQADLEPLLISLLVGVLGGVIVGMMLVATIREAFIRPILTTMVMLEFHTAVANQSLDPASVAKLEKLSEGLEEGHRLRRIFA